MENTEKIEAVTKVGKSQGAAETTIEKVQGVANQDHFEALMMQQQPQKQAAAAQPIEAVTAENKKPSLMDQVADLSRKVDNVKKVQPTDIVAQAQDIMSRMSSIKDQLAVPNQAIKPAYTNLLKNKLTHINENLRIALSAAGVETLPPAGAAATNNPIDRFLGFLTDGQAQLSTLAKEVETMHLNKNSINAGAMLAVQIKVGFIQQELEFFSSVLNKALESTKTIMNVQV
jgi:hypothetical protein